ncbi:ubiquinone biosynthesis hydroxylase [Amorphus orientalis]|uniref:2-octaprenyl-6-methoxyphenol hydroxylase n=1 Tax=Amorphus orientalis TaxID=649198 RepID=A0AAE4ARH2_9HYPH|nr:ubiquinone biosynthesis hydroxylase [Amorphus orientalis]MDQ0313830.1 2-octaprenyl-6-methoxyphenol hydroxylase [Amorphus orientalis]
MSTVSDHVDVAIAGAGSVGMTLALALKRADPRLSVAVIDPKPVDATRGDDRASAIAAAARRMLVRLGVWPDVAADAQSIDEMIITDSRLRDAVRPVFLRFLGDVEPGEPYAHMIPNDVLFPAIARHALDAGIRTFTPDSVRIFETGDAGSELRLASGTRLSAALLIACDGKTSRLRGLAGIRTVGHAYDQSGIVTTVSHELPHQGCAIEHFLPAGPFAVLPLKGNRSSIVWTERTAEANRLVGLDDFSFEIELARRFGPDWGEIRLAGSRSAYPLSVQIARDLVAPRFALAGDAAHAIHPIAGQGLNMGFRDAAALAETVVEARRIGLDIGSLDVLERYQSWRRFDTLEMAATTDLLNRLFSNDVAPVRLARTVGLGLVDRLPGLKRVFIREAAGLAASSPKLLRGEAI